MSEGQKNIQTPESREKRRQLVSGNKNPMYGRFWTDEQKAAHSKKVKGKPSPMLGKRHSEETLNKMRGKRGPNKRTKSKQNDRVITNCNK